MTLQEFREQAFAAALRQGCDAAETYAVDGDSFTVYILDGQVDQYVSSRDFGVGVRVLKDGKNGYAYTESLNDPEAVVARAIDNAVVIESDDEHPMQTRQEYVTVTERDNPVMAMTEREKIDLALRMEQATKALDPRVRRMVYDVVSTSRTTVRLHNTLGLCAEQTVHSSDSYLAPLLQEGEEMRDGGAARYDEEVLDVDGIAAEAVREAAAMFGAEPVPAGEYAVVPPPACSAASPRCSAPMTRKRACRCWRARRARSSPPRSSPSSTTRCISARRAPLTMRGPPPSPRPSWKTAY